MKWLKWMWENPSNLNIWRRSEDRPGQHQCDSCSGGRNQLSQQFLNQLRLKVQFGSINVKIYFRWRNPVIQFQVSLGLAWGGWLDSEMKAGAHRGSSFLMLLTAECRRVWFPSISTTHFVLRSFSENNIEHQKAHKQNVSGKKKLISRASGGIFWLMPLMVPSTDKQPLTK